MLSYKIKDRVENTIKTIYKMKIYTVFKVLYNDNKTDSVKRKSLWFLVFFMKIYIRL